MNSVETIEYVQTLKLSEVLLLREKAGTGHYGAVSLWVAYAAVKKCLQDGIDPLLLAPILDRLELKIEVV